MTQEIRDRLASIADSYELVRRLHDVPPHEVWEARVDGERAVYKGNTGPTGHATTEGHVTAFVDAHTSVPVPTVLHVGDGDYLAAWHPDAPDPDPSTRRPTPGVERRAAGSRRSTPSRRRWSTATASRERRTRG